MLYHNCTRDNRIKQAQKKEKYYSQMFAAQETEIIIQNLELNHRFGKCLR